MKTAGDENECSEVFGDVVQDNWGGGGVDVVAAAAVAICCVQAIFRYRSADCQPSDWQWNDVLLPLLWN